MHTTTILFFVISLFISKISLSQDSKQELLSSQNILFKDDIFINIAKYLEAPDLSKFAMTNSIHDRNMSSNENLGKILRKNNNHSVVTSDDQYYYDQEYLSQSDHLSFSSFNNPHIILKDNIHLFLKLFLVENSKHSSRLESHFLKELYQDKFNINQLIENLPTYTSSHEKLAGIIIDSIFWDHLKDRVRRTIKLYTNFSTYQVFPIKIVKNMIADL